jgi:CDP-paratose 2-epimerase
MEVEKIPQIGILEWFHIGEYDRAEKVISILKELKNHRAQNRTLLAEWEMPEGKEWISWIIPHLGKEFKLLPCLVYTPPHLGIAPKTCSPPKDVNDYKKFVEDIILRFGHYFDYVELWNEPYNPVEWDTSLDPNYSIFSDMIRIAAEAQRDTIRKPSSRSLAHATHFSFLFSIREAP